MGDAHISILIQTYSQAKTYIRKPNNNNKKLHILDLKVTWYRNSYISLKINIFILAINVKKKKKPIVIGGACKGTLD